MAPERIDKLLDLYFDGQTSTAEEVELRYYFSLTVIAERHARLAPIFMLAPEILSQCTDSELPSPKDVEIEMQALKAMSIDTEARKKPTRLALWPKRIAIGSIGIAAAIAMFFTINRRNELTITPALDVYADLYDLPPEETYGYVEGARIDDGAMAKGYANEAFSAVAFNAETSTISEDALIELLLPSNP